MSGRSSTAVLNNRRPQSPARKTRRTQNFGGGQTGLQRRWLPNAGGPRPPTSAKDALNLVEGAKGFLIYALFPFRALRLPIQQMVHMAGRPHPPPPRGTNSWCGSPPSSTMTHTPNHAHGIRSGRCQTKDDARRNSLRMNPACCRASRRPFQIRWFLPAGRTAARF